MRHTTETAHEISQRVLDATGHALLCGDVKSFVTFFNLPMEIQTYEGQTLIQTVDGIRKVYQSVRNHYQKIGVTDMVRHCVAASHLDSKTILTTHETRLLNGVVMVQKPFPAMSTLRLEGIHWRITSTSYAIEDCDDHNLALMSAGERSEFSVG
ncbi:MAG: hypothetical protein ABJ360_23920 [Roseobacter sp.]